MRCAGPGIAEMAGCGVSFLRTHTRYAEVDLQKPFDVAVVIPSINRPTLHQAVTSVLRQDFVGTVQILVGLDCEPDERLSFDPPIDRTVQTFWPGYSTSTRHGGLTPSHDGGALRTILTYLANARLVAYLDDDNWWAPNHLTTLVNAIDGFDWAFSYRWFVDPNTREPLAIDLWESGGPGQGVHKDGFVDPSCLMINKTRCPSAPQCWMFPLSGDPMSADCTMFGFLSRHHSWRSTGEATAFYTLNPRDRMFPERLRWIEEAKMLEGYTEALEARARLHGQRKAEQEAEAQAAKDGAAHQTAEYIAALEVQEVGDAA